LTYIVDQGGCVSFVIDSISVHDSLWIGDDFRYSDHRCSCSSSAVKVSDPEFRMLSVVALFLLRLHCSSLIVDMGAIGVSLIVVPALRILVRCCPLSYSVVSFPLVGPGRSGATLGALLYIVDIFTVGLRSRSSCVLRPHTSRIFLSLCISDFGVRICGTYSTA
jgi:hypothetical protein